MAGDDLTLYYGEILLLQFRLLSFVMSLCLFAPAYLLVLACINYVMFNDCMHNKNVTTPMRTSLQHLD